ncbi:c-type cytochrome [Halalkalibacterium ligniniphilum]|uniref:c-type cytochrome n=1 Tax=Halalkalibacterium ligniniphilum TaxID=1134413 RepID=UPI00034828C9|nr:c-type cytochrome [Halalkalibacterium ligniniphilum]
MKKFLFAIGAVLVLGACGGGGDEAPTDEAPAEEAPAEETAGDFDATLARETYEASCISCHGGNLEGGGGPALAGSDYSVEHIIDVIHNGKGSMPPQNVPDEEAENLAKWIAEQ